MNKVKKVLLSFMMVVLMIFSSGCFAVFATEADSTETSTPPAYDVTIKIVPEKGWLVNTTKVNVKVIDNKNTGTLKIKKLEAKIGVNGSWKDITKKGSIEVAENCTVYVQATDSYGTVYSQTRYLSGYDTTPPTFNAAVNNGVLTIEAHDAKSGVDCIYINGYKFKPNKKGKLTVRLQKFDATYTNFSIYVTDNSGNESEPYVIDNPYYKKEDTGKNEKENKDSPNPSDSLPTDATANKTGESAAQITSVTNEKGNDISKKVDGKQFYSVVTKNGQQFYIVIDMSGQEHFEGSADDTAEGSTTGATSSGGTVYFLTNISNNDLLNVTDDGEVTLPYNSQAAGNAIDEEDSSEKAIAKKAEKKESKETKKSSSGSSVIYIIFGIIAFGVIIVVFRSKKSGKSRTDIIDEDDEEEEDVELTADNMNQFIDQDKNE